MAIPLEKREERIDLDSQQLRFLKEALMII